MWNSCAKFDRLKKAIERHGLDPKALNLNEAAKLLKKRGITDTVQNSMTWQLIHLLEPPACTMTHCEHFGGQGSFCNCSLERVPGQCPILRDYKKRQKEKKNNPTRLDDKINFICENVLTEWKGYGYDYRKQMVFEHMAETGKTLEEIIAQHKTTVTE